MNTGFNISELRFLVVDDLPNICTLFSSILHDFGWKNVSVSTSGEKALALLKEKDFDFVLLDINMEGMDGLDVLDQINSLPILFPPHVIMITADASRDSLNKALQKGAADFIVKPFQPAVLQMKIKKIFAESKMQNTSRLMR
ncbi:response regulator [Thiomicrorhabdus xiamenensis]|uniref:Response regulator n=1 Tax=Thiomicrorhabdus xiamenensis TaxID=2739063 RepID=A0A7D4T1R9_9GAMM|nr:response regulator [Thiomicrorhabdus xiamenensis]QKI90142.1 response regulator [Thiomicrorhabdus xiamenensis]